MKNSFQIRRPYYLLVILTSFYFHSCNNLKSGIKPQNEIAVADLEGKILPKDGLLPKIDSEPIIVFDKLSFGSGYNSSNAHEYFSVMEYSSIADNTEIISSATGNTGFVEIHKITKKDSLRKVLDITKNASIKAKFGKIGGGKASYKERKFQETRIGELNEIAIVKAQYVNEPRIILNPKLKSSLLKLARTNPKEFMHTAGDMFVSKVYTGGTLYGVFNLNARHYYQKKKNELFVKASGSYLGISASGSIDIKKTQEAFNETSKLDVSYITEGGADSLGDINTIDGFLDGAKVFKKQVSIGQGHPVILYVQLEPYENIAGFPKIDFSPIRVVQKKMLEKCQQISYDIDESMANVLDVINNETYYSKEDVKKAREFKSLLPQLEKKLKIEYEKSLNNFEYKEEEVLNTISMNLPFKPSLIKPIPFYLSKKLKADAGDQSIMNSSNTSGKFLFIDGKLASLERGKAKEELRDLKYQFNDRRHRATLSKPYPYIRDFYPYYLVTFKDIASKNIISEIKYSGKEIEVPANVSIEIKLVNQNSQYLDSRRRSRRSLPYTKYLNVRILDISEPIVKIYEKEENLVVKTIFKSRYYVHPIDGLTYIICEDDDGFIVILPSGETQGYGPGYTLSEVRQAHGLPSSPFRTDEHEETCGDKW
ncbi:hypothetical protein ACFSQJ_01390 [Croceitalea marina]|uniref:Lipoprotein n=1 Tax=Croceitalea marina TaxID=1775166 RepID=A0ABW5MS06_9FLAO